MRLTNRQRQGLRRIRKSSDGTEALSPDLARQLINKGLVRHDTDYLRMEWNRVVARLWVCSLTIAGEEVAKNLEQENKAT